MPEVITQKLVEKVLRESRRQEITDVRVRGLVLRGTQKGATWAVRSDKGGKTVKVGIGSPPEMGLAQARTIAAAAVGRLNAGLAVDFRWIESQRVDFH